MQRGLDLLFHMLTWQKAKSHPAAIFAQRRLAEAVGAPPQAPQLSKNAKRKLAASGPDTSAASPTQWALGADEKKKMMPT